MATAAQKLAFMLADDRLSRQANIIANFDAIWAKYAAQLAPALPALPVAVRDDAVALLMANQLRLSQPDNINAAGAQTSASASPGSSRSFAPTDLRPGYPVDWSKNSAGHRLIGLFQGSASTLPTCL